MKMTSKLRLSGAGALLGPAACAELLLIYMPVTLASWRRERTCMLGQTGGDQNRLFYSFNLDEHVPADHLLRGID